MPDYSSFWEDELDKYRRSVSGQTDNMGPDDDEEEFDYWNPPEIKGPGAQQEEIETGNVLDLLGSTLWGAASGLTWGASEFVAKSKPWEEMNSMERTGWVLGEGGSLFAPWGPFGVMGKGASKIARAGGNKFINEAAQDAVTHIVKKNSDDLLRGAEKVAIKSNKTVNEVLKGLQKDTYTALQKTVQDDTGARWLMELTEGGVTSAAMKSQLTMTSSHAVFESFTKAGIKDVAKADIQAITSAWTRGLAKGEYVNDVAHWLERGLKGELPGNTRKFLSKYLGMAANDAWMMGAHSLVSANVKAYARGEEMPDQKELLSHSGMMALAFPGIRMLGGGGKEALGTGVKAYFQRFKGTNYDKILDQHGTEATKNLLKITLTGSKKDLFSKSKLQGMKFRGLEKEYPTGADVLGEIPSMSGAEAVQLLKHTNKLVSHVTMKEWGPRFRNDLIMSSPRMALGTLAMNPWMLNKDAWGEMDGKELAAHMFMGAAMTKGRGGWGRGLVGGKPDALRTSLADYTPYTDVMSKLNIDIGSVDATLRMHRNWDLTKGMGASFNTNDAGRKVVEAFDRAFNDGEAADYSDGGFQPDKHGNAHQWGSIYNLAKGFADPNHIELDVTTLSAKRLNRIQNDIDSISFEGGETVKQIGYWGSIVKITKDQAEGVKGYYGNMMRELGELGLPVEVGENGQIHGRLVGASGDAKDIGQAVVYNKTLKALDRLGIASLRKSETVTYENMEAIRGKDQTAIDEFNDNIHAVTRKWMDRLDAEFDGKMIAYETHENPYLKFLGKAREVESADQIHRVISGTGVENSPERILTSAMDAIFERTDKYGKTGYLPTIDHYEFDGLLPESGNKDQITKNDAITDSKAALRHLFDLRKTAIGQVNGDNPGAEIPRGSLDGTAKSAVDMMAGLAPEWKNNFYENTLNMHMQRLFGSNKMDRRAVHLAKTLVDLNYGVYSAQQQKLKIPSAEQVVKSLKLDVNGEQAKEVYEMQSFIKKVMGETVVEENFSYDQNAPGKHDTIDIGALKKAYDSLQNVQFQDFMTDVQTGLGKLGSVNSNVQDNIEGIFKSTERVRKALDSSDNYKDPQVLDSIEGVSVEIDRLVKMSKDPANTESLNTALLELQTLSEHISKEVKGFDIAKAAKKATDTVQDIVRDIFVQEQEAKIYFRDTMNQLLNLQSKGIGASGLEVGHAMKISEELAMNLHKQLTNKDETKLLSDVMEEFNSTGYWGDATKIVKSINEQMHMQVIANNNHELNNESYHIQKEQGERTKKEGHRSLLDIGREYGLMDIKDPNRFKPSFVRTLVNDGPDVAFKQIEKHISDNTSLSKQQKDIKWQTFLDRDALELGTHLLNQKVIKTVNLKPGLLTFDNEKVGKVEPRTNFFSNEGYDVFFIDGKVSAMVRGKLVNVDIDYLYNNPGKVQEMVTGTSENPNMRITGAQKEFTDSLVDSGVKISATDVYNMANVRVNPLMYMRISPKNKILFTGSKENIKNLNEKYNSWYADKLEYFGKKGETQRSAFERKFGNLKSERDARHFLELKMMLQYMDKTGQRGMFDAYIKELAMPTPDATKLATIEANMYKRGQLTDGGTTSMLNSTMLGYINTRHSDGAVRLQAKKNLDSGMTTALFHDEMGADSPFNVKQVAKEFLQYKINQRGGSLTGSLAERQLRTIDEIESLDFSVFDGAKFLSLDQAKLMFAMKGGLGEFNGAKSIIFGGGDNQMLGKGYMVYHPDVAKFMPKGVDMLIGESSAKTYSATSLSGKELTPFKATKGAQILGLGHLLEVEMKAMSPDHITSLPIESVGLSFTSKNSNRVNISPSIFDWQSEAVTRHGIEKWMKIDKIIDDIGAKWAGKDLSNELGKLLYDITEENAGAFQQTYGDEAITKKLILYGASPDNPLITPVIERLLRNEDFKILNNVSSIHGQDSFITPNVMNDLAMPIYADIVSKEVKGRGWRANDQTYKDQYRVTANVGGIGLNGHTMKRAYEGSGEMFYARDNQDIDWLVTVEDGGIKVSSSFYNRIDKDHKAMGGKRFVVDFEQRKTINNASKLKAAIGDINKKAAKYNLTTNDIFNLLHNPDGITTVNPVTKKHTKVRLTAASKAIVQGMHLEQAEMGHAVPKIGHDMIGHRIQKVLNDGGYTMNGLVELNHWDLRVAHQRDHDGDHFTSFTKMPFDIAKEFFNQNGMKKDFIPPKSNVDNNIANIFGFGEKGIAGENSHDSGFHNYSNLMNTRQRAIGQIIGARRSLSWASLAGLKIQGVGGSKHIPFLKDFSKDSAQSDPVWEKLTEMYDIMQGTVDFHGPRSRELEADLLWDNYFNGYKGQAEGGEARSSGHSVFGDGVDAEFAQSHLGQTIFKVITRTLRKGNVIANDVWDEAGSRAPTPKEIKDIHGNLEMLFKSPDQYIIGEVMKEISRMRYGSKADAAKANDLLMATMNRFYPDYSIGNVKNKVAIELFMKDLYSGKIAAPKEKVFKFDKDLTVASDGTVKQRHDPWGLTFGGHAVNKLVKKNVYWGGDMGGVTPDRYEVAGARVSDVINRVEMARAFGESFATISERMSIKDMFMADESLGEVNTQHMFTRGVAADLLNRQYKQVSNQIRFFNEERFVNDTKMERLYEQKDNIAAAIDVMDKSISDGMVVELRHGRLDYIMAKTGESAPKGPQTKKFDNKVYVYRIKGNLDVKTGTVDNLDAPPERLDYGKLEHLGFYDENGSLNSRSSKPLVLQKGYQYIIDTNPRNKVSMSQKEYRYGRAAFEATYGDRTNPDIFMEGGDVELFRETTRALRTQISSDYIKTGDKARKERVLRNEIYNEATVFEQRSIDEYMKEWENSVETDGTLTEVGTLMRYILQPQPLVREYYSAHDIDMPAYKMNNRLYQSVITWAENNGHSGEVKSLIQHIEQAKDGKRLDHNISSYTNMSKADIYDYTRLGMQANAVKTIMENYSGFFASPILTHQMQMVDKRSLGQSKYVRGVNGEVVAIRVPRPGKEHNQDKRGCK